MPRKFVKFKLLLDENFPSRLKFPRLNHRFDLKHLVVDFRKSGVTDPQVYRFACQQKRIIITFNDRDFRKMAEKSTLAGIIGVSKNLTNQHIDKKINSLLLKSFENDLYGKFIYISGEK